MEAAWSPRVGEEPGFPVYRVAQPKRERERTYSHVPLTFCLQQMPSEFAFEP